MFFVYICFRLPFIILFAAALQPQTLLLCMQPAAFLCVKRVMKIKLLLFIRLLLNSTLLLLLLKLLNAL